MFVLFSILQVGAMSMPIIAAAKMDSVTQSHFSYPNFLPKGSVESLFHAHQHHFYENSLDATTKIINGLMDPKALAKISPTEEGNSEPTCLSLLLQSVLAYYAGVPYARQMDDSMGRRESGIFQGNYMWLGRYHECSDATNGVDINGKLCTVILSVIPNNTNGIWVGLCLPDICTEGDINGVIRSLLGSNTTRIYVSAKCPEPVTLDAVDITAIVICSLLGAFVFFGTSYEVYCFVQEDTRVKTGGKKHERNTTVMKKLTLSFSAINNTKVLLDTTQKEGNIHVLNGLRFLSMSWVILGHTFNFIILVMDNFAAFSRWAMNHGTFQVVINGALSVDTFFFLSGLLVAYLGLKEMEERDGKMNIPLMYLSRYLRLTPTMAMIMLLTVTLMPIIVEGPLEPLGVDNRVELCQKYWWTNLLYINNLYPAKINDECIEWVWYLANDMQFYLLSPIFLYLLYRYPKAGLGVFAGIVIANCAIVGALSTHYELMPNSLAFAYIFGLFSNFLQPNSTDVSRSEPIPEGTVYFDDIYTKPWCRIGVYVIGMATGYIIYATKGKIKMNKVFVAIMWAAVTAIELTLVYGWSGASSDLDNFPSQDLSSFYNAVLRPLWGLGLSWLTIACVSGYGEPINLFLSWKMFIPLSRLTFCAYLVHPLVFLYMFNSREIEIHFEVNIMIYYFLAAMLLSYGLAYLLHLCVEAPMGGIQKIIFPRKKRPEPRQKIPEIGTNGEMIVVNQSNGHAEKPK